MIDSLRGRRCVSLRRFHHRFEGGPASETGPIEFTWDDGTWLTVDVKTDWTLELSEQPWSDPFARASASQRRELAVSVGLWEQAPMSAELCRLVGRVVTSAVLDLNEVGGAAGLTVAFDGLSVSARVAGGELAVEVHER
ncbi:MAG: hypothetical protein QM713_06220 [Arachnia sp.]